jgi:hypothetical protein
MVAFFKYSPVDILSVNLPPSVLDFNFHSPQEWMKSVAIEVCYFIVLAETTHFLNSTHQSWTEEQCCSYVFVSRYLAKWNCCMWRYLNFFAKLKRRL